MELGKNFAENVRRVDDCLRVRENFDLIKKELTVGGRETVFYYPDGMVDADAMEKLMVAVRLGFAPKKSSWLLTTG